MRTLVLSLDGGDYGLISSLVQQGRMPTLSRLAREGTFGPLESTIPAVTPTAWSSFLTGLKPGRARDLQLRQQPPTAIRTASRAQRAARGHRCGATWDAPACVRPSSVFPSRTRRRTSPASSSPATGDPSIPRSRPPRMRERVHTVHPEYLTAHHPMAERWWEDFDGYASKLLRHVEQTADICRMALELEPGSLASVRELHERRPCGAPRLPPPRREPSRPRSGVRRRRAHPGLRGGRPGVCRPDRRGRAGSSTSR